MVDKDKILKGRNGKLYYPFNESIVWVYDPKKDKWNPIPQPKFLIYTADDGLLDLADECCCSPRDLFNFGCRCQVASTQRHHN